MFFYQKSNQITKIEPKLIQTLGSLMLSQNYRIQFADFPLTRSELDDDLHTTVRNTKMTLVCTTAK